MKRFLLILFLLSGPVGCGVTPYMFQLDEGSYVVHGYYIGERKDVGLWVNNVSIGGDVEGPIPTLAIRLVVRNNRRETIYFDHKVNRLKLGSQDLLDRTSLETRIKPGENKLILLTFRLPESSLPKRGTLMVEGIKSGQIGTIKFPRILFFKEELK